MDRLAASPWPLGLRRSAPRSCRRSRCRATPSSGDFRFASGETLPEAEDPLRHVRPAALDDSRGRTANAVLVLHGTGGSSAQFLGPKFAGVLFGPGQPLDASRYFIVIPDGIGHGASSKPSDGLQREVPALHATTTWSSAQHRLLTEALGVTTCGS